jgi:hypothetical protein
VRYLAIGCGMMLICYLARGLLWSSSRASRSRVSISIMKERKCSCWSFALFAIVTFAIVFSNVGMNFAVFSSDLVLTSGMHANGQNTDWTLTVVWAL